MGSPARPERKMWTNSGRPQARIGDGSRRGTLGRMPVPPYECPSPDGLPRIVSRDQALARGLSRRAIEWRLARQQWHRVLPHVYLTGNTLTWWDRLDAALTLGGPD